MKAAKRYCQVVLGPAWLLLLNTPEKSLSQMAEPSHYHYHQAGRHVPMKAGWTLAASCNKVKHKPQQVNMARVAGAPREEGSARQVTNKGSRLMKATAEP